MATADIEKQPIAWTAADPKREPEINKLFRTAMKLEASDLHLKVGQPPMMRLHGDIRRIAEAMVGEAESSLHHWLNLTLEAGGVLVVLGVIAAALGGLRKS